MARLKVLIVDDEHTITFALSHALPGTWAIHSETDAHRALERLLKEDFDVVLLDIMIPHMTGMAIFKELTEKKPTLAENVIFITGGLYIPAVQVFAASLPNHTFLEKPFHAHEVVEAVLALIAKKNKNGTTPTA